MFTDWYEQGCRRKCSEQHTYKWGDCALAPESAKPEPTVSLSKALIAEDGHPALGYDTYTVLELADLIEPALRATGCATSPTLAYVAAHAIVHRNDKDPDPRGQAG